MISFWILEWTTSFSLKTYFRNSSKQNQNDIPGLERPFKNICQQFCKKKDRYCSCSIILKNIAHVVSFETSTLCICSLCIMKWSWDQIVTDISAKFMSHWVTFEIMQYECNPGVWIMQLVHNKIYSNIYVCVWLGHFWDNAIYERFTDCILGSLNMCFFMCHLVSLTVGIVRSQTLQSSYIVSILHLTLFTLRGFKKVLNFFPNFCRTHRVPT